MIDDAALRAQLQQQPPPVHIPRLMAKAPAMVQTVAGTNPDGSSVVILLISSANGDFAFPLEPDFANTVGENLLTTARQAKSGLITP